MKIDLHLMDGPEPQRIELEGREAWAMLQLIAAGEKGCTPIDNPGPRWSAYIYTLRQRGISIETIRERHGGAFSGNHGRYVLRSHVRVLEAVE